MNFKFYYMIFWMEVFLSKNLRAAWVLDQEPIDNLASDNPFIPIKYYLNIFTHLTIKEPYYGGTVRIIVRCTAETNIIELNFTYLRIHNKGMSVKLLKENEIPESSINIHSKIPASVLKTLKITLDETLMVGRLYEVNVAFSNPLITVDQKGYALHKYTIDPQDIPKKMTFIELDNFGISSVFPCFENINRRTKFVVRSYHPGNFVGFSSGKLKSTEPYEKIPGWVVDEFEETTSLAPFSIAISVMDLKKTEMIEDSSKVEIRVWTDEKFITAMGYMNNVSSLCFQYFFKYFGTTGELKKLDILIVPFNPEEYLGSYGLVMMSLVSVVYSTQIHSSWDYYAGVIKICRAISKQWIGHMVTLLKRKELWVHHGLNLFLQTKCAVELHWKFELGMLLEDITDSFILLLQWQPEKSLKEIWEFEYDYNLQWTKKEFRSPFFVKVEYMFRMIHFALGSTSFQLSLINYINKFKFENTNSNELWSIFTETAQEAGFLPSSVSIKRVAETFFTQNGCPIIFVEYSKKAKSITLRQEPYKHLEEKNESNSAYWIIPIRFTTKSKVNFEENIPCEWLDFSGPMKRNFVLDPSDWYLLNLQLNVLAHVHYDDKNWTKIQDTLLNDHLSIDLPSRVRLVIDMFALAEGGLLNYKFVFRTMKYLSQEHSYLPWKVALEEFEKIRIRLFGTNLFNPFEKYVRSILETVYENPEFKDMDQFHRYDHMMHVFKVSIIESSYKFGVVSCREQIKKLSEKLKNIPSKVEIFVPNSIYKLCMCDDFIQDPSYNHCNKYFEMMRQNMVGELKKENIAALTCCTDQTFILRYLEWIFDLSYDSSLTSEERLSVFRLMAKNVDEKGHRVMRQFFMDQFSYVDNQHGLEALVSFSMAVFEMTTKKNDLNQLIEFLTSKTSNEDITDSKMENFEKSIKRGRRNILWIERNRDSLKDYFKRHKFRRSWFGI